MSLATNSTGGGKSDWSGLKKKNGKREQERRQYFLSFTIMGNI